MPDLNDFEEGFGLIKNKNYEGYFLDSIIGTHQTIVRNRKYKYYIKLTYSFHNPGMSVDLFYNHHVFQNRVINSHYGNPYLCKLWKVNFLINGNNLEVNLEGESERI